MEAVVHGPEFTPPPEGGVLRSLAFAVVAHLLLLLALSVSVQWKRDDTRVSAEAELWSPTVQQAAPKPVEAPPPPPPAPVVEKQVVQPPAPPVKSDADIAIEREKARAAQEKARQEELERQRIAAEKKRKDELARQEQAREEQARQEQARRDQLAKQEQAKQLQAKKAAEERKREEQVKLARQQDEQLKKLHDETVKKMQTLADATGPQTATGNATRSSGPSDSYGGRVRARVRPNIYFTDNVAGNPSAEVEVRLAPDGTIVGRTLRKSSGVGSWDEAVLRAIDRTEVLPRDIDGRVPSSMVLVFRPRD